MKPRQYRQSSGKRGWRQPFALTLPEERILSSSAARRRTGAHPPRRRRLAARGDGGDAHRDPARDSWQAQAHPGVHQPVRVDDRHRPHHPAQRQALVLGRDGATVDGRRDARSREAVPQGHPATSTCRASPSRSSDDSTFPSPTPSRPRRPQSQSLCNDHTGTVVTEVPRQTGQPRPPPEFPSWKAVGTTEFETASRAGIIDADGGRHDACSGWFRSIFEARGWCSARGWCVPAPLGVLTHCRAAPAGSRSAPSAGGASESLLSV